VGLLHRSRHGFIRHSSIALTLKGFTFGRTGLFAPPAGCLGQYGCSFGDLAACMVFAHNRCCSSRQAGMLRESTFYGKTTLLRAGLRVGLLYWATTGGLQHLPSCPFALNGVCLVWRSCSSAPEGFSCYVPPSRCSEETRWAGLGEPLLWRTRYLGRTNCISNKQIRSKAQVVLANFILASILFIQVAGGR
jgi:hypothetical protein